MTADITIGDRAIAPDGPAYVIAVAGASHDGELAKAKRLIAAAADFVIDPERVRTISLDRSISSSARNSATTIPTSPTGSTASS